LANFSLMLLKYDAMRQRLWESLIDAGTLRPRRQGTKYAEV